MVEILGKKVVRRVDVGVAIHEYVRKKISYDVMSRRIAELNRGDGR